MKVTTVERQQMAYRVERARLQNLREQQYQTTMEKRKYDRIVADRIARNHQLERDKGLHVDVNC